MRLVRRYSDVMELNLSLGPGQGGGTFKRCDVMVLVGQANNFFARTSEKCPKMQANGRAGRDADALANAKDRIENSANCVRESAAAADRNWRADVVPPAKEA